MTYNTFKNSEFVVQSGVEHNARFVKKSFHLDINTLNAIENWVKSDGVITVCKAGRRSKANTSFPVIRGSVSHMGAKSNTLKSSGKAKGKQGA